MADDRLRWRRTDRLHRPVRRLSRRAVHHACAPGPRQRLRAAVRRELLRIAAPRRYPPVRSRAHWCRCCSNASPVTRMSLPKAAPTSGTHSGWCRSATRSGTTACGWKYSRCATTGRTPRSACACAAASSGPATPGRSRSSWRSSPMPMSSSRTTARCTAIRRTAASTTSSASIRSRCWRAACSTITAATPMRRRWPRAASRRPSRRPCAAQRTARLAGRPHVNALLFPHFPPDALPHDRLGRPLRDLRLSVIEACNFRCPYCMPADRVRDDHGFDDASRLDFDEIETLVRGFVRLGMTQAAPDRRRAAAAQAPAGACRAPCRDSGHRRPGADHQWIAAGAPCARAARCRLAALDDQPGCAGRRRVPSLVRRSRPRRGRPRRHRRGPGRRLPPDQVQLRRAARHQRRPGAAARASTSAHGGHVLRFIEYMDVGTCNGWDRDARGALGRTARPHPCALAAAGARCRTTAARSRCATRSRTAPAKSDSSVR